MARRAIGARGGGLCDRGGEKRDSGPDVKTLHAKIGQLAWRLSISLAADAAVEALQEALTRYGTPEIMNTDQGSQFHCQRLHWRAARTWHPHQHGRERLLARQRLR
jgi:hypothetical protein